MTDQTSNPQSVELPSNHSPSEGTEVQDQPKVKKTWEDAVISWWHDKKHVIFITLFIFAFLIVYLWNQIFITIKPGEAGVLWRRVEMLGYEKGTVLDTTYGEGLQVIFPLLHKEVGPDYVDRIIIPEVQSTIRQIIGEYAPDEIYRSQGGILRNVVLSALGEIGERYIELDDLLIQEIILPELVRTSIETKLQEEQKSLEYEYRLVRESQEAQRKEIEADGIARFQAKINEGITEDFLRYKGIEATLALAQSNNAKVVVIGSSPNGLPLILNTNNSDPVIQSDKSPVVVPPVAPVSPAVPPNVQPEAQQPR